MQEWGKAVFQISQAETSAVDRNGKQWQGATWTDAEERMKGYRQRFEQIAQRLMFLP